VEDEDALDAALAALRHTPGIEVIANRHHPELFEGIARGTDRVLAQTVAAAKRARLDVELLEPWADLDTPEALRGLTGPEGVAPRTRGWAHGSRLSRGVAPVHFRRLHPPGG
jgi:glycosyltransferase A (GT-A) superfamily protein (DUF2064 family)